MKKELSMIVVALLLMAVVSYVVKENSDGSSDETAGSQNFQKSTPYDDLGPNEKWVKLNKENNFTDQTEEGLFTRKADSGPGTGVFVGDGFEFTNATCDYVYDQGANNFGWAAGVAGCKEKVLISDWCARRIDHPDIIYNIHFLSWTISSGDDFQCIGDCEKNDNQAAYLRTKYERK